MSISEPQLWAWMMDGKHPPVIDELGMYEAHQQGIHALERRATAVLSQDIHYTQVVKRKVITPAMRRKGKTEREITKTLPKGSRVKVVMASRMGDVGITPNLKAHNGYVARINCIEGEWDALGDGQCVIPLKPEGVLTDIKPIEDDLEKVSKAFPNGAKAPEDYDE